MSTQGKNFKIGDDVVAFEYIREAYWKPCRLITYEGEVIAVQDDKVYVDTAFGVMSFESALVEYDDVPF